MCINRHEHHTQRRQPVLSLQTGGELQSAGHRLLSEASFTCVSSLADCSRVYVAMPHLRRARPQSSSVLDLEWHKPVKGLRV